MINHTTMLRKIFLIALCFSLILPLAAGCGKQGNPRPRKTQDMFTFANAAMSVINECLVVNGTVQGAVRNVDSIVVEVAPIVSYDECPGCPFSPQEWSEYSGPAVRLDPDSGLFTFSFCPSTPAPMYRWRLVGKNVYPGLPYATTTPQVVKVRDSGQSF